MSKVLLMSRMRIILFTIIKSYIWYRKLIHGLIMQSFELQIIRIISARLYLFPDIL